MTQDIMANFFTFSDDLGTIQINYYPYARLEYQGPEGKFVYPSASPGGESMTVQEQSWLGQQVNVVLVPSVEGTSVALTLLLPSVKMAGHTEQDFDTIAIKTTSSEMLPSGGGGAHLRSALLTRNCSASPPTALYMAGVSARGAKGCLQGDCG